MTESKRLVELVDDAIDRFLSGEAQTLLGVSPELASFIEHARALLAGGKRFRALFCYWGWEAVCDPEQTTANELDAVVDAAAALELFHAAALVHDDIIDNSDTRRGLPAAHRWFESVHTQSGWSGDATTFGTSGAILLGDLLLGWSDQLLDSGLARLPSREAATAARRVFNRMRTEVTGGQYLDILEEHSWRSRDESELLGRAENVVTYKSAKYSIQAPLLIGAAIGGGSLEQVETLEEFGLPLGVAFQLRDDLLGVYGDPKETGKPAGDDLREGKRTVLIALARHRLTPSAARFLDELLGDQDLDEEQIRTLQASIRGCGAVDAVEAMITDNVETAMRALESSRTLSDSSFEQLSSLARTVTRRNV